VYVQRAWMHRDRDAACVTAACKPLQHVCMCSVCMCSVCMCSVCVWASCVYVKRD
jgi:hypothetical protein